MKKITSFVLTVVVLICTLWFNAGSATAAGTITYTGARFVWGKGVVFVFDASGYRNRDVKNASLSIGPDSFGVHCTVNKKAGKIICVAGGGLTRYAGQMGILTVAGHSFYVKIPDKGPLPSVNGNVPLTCPPGTEPGALVTFLTGGGDQHTEFITGATLDEVRSKAEGMVDGSDWVEVLSVGNLECRQ
jgi:hypothetical protein